MNAPARICLLLAAVAAGFGHAPHAQCTSGPPTGLGVATPLASGVPATGINIPDTTLTILAVDCSPLPLVGCQLQISEPPAGVPYRGTIVVGSGAQGIAPYSGETFGLPLFLRLQALGFRMVDRIWAPSWFGNTLSMRKQSVRYATMLNWVHDNVHTGGPFMVLGSSGGAAEIGFSLTTWNTEEIIDVAVTTGGPPLTRLDQICPMPASAAWLAECASLIPPNVMECPNIVCSRIGGFGICNKCGATPTLSELRNDGVLHPQADTDYPNTHFHMLTGAEDCYDTVPSSMQFFNEVTSHKISEFVPRTPHFVVQTPQGETAITRALLGALACPGGPTLAWRSWPTSGGSLVLDVKGEPNDTYYILYSASEAEIEVAPFGWLFVGFPFLVIAHGNLDANGVGTFTTAIPPTPALVGPELYTQALVGSCLTNIARWHVLPSTESP